MVKLGSRGRYRSNRTHGQNVPQAFLTDSSGESPDKPENILIRVVEGHRRNSESVGLAPIADDAFPGQPFTQRPPSLGHSDGNLRAAPVTFSRGDDRKFFQDLPVHQKLFQQKL